VDRATGVATLITRQWPVTQVLAVQTSPYRCIPPTWSPVPAGYAIIRTPVELPLSGVPLQGPSGGNAIDVAPGYIDSCHGRGYFRVLYSVTCGWPHTSLTGAAEAEATEISVDDVTGWDAIPSGFAWDAAMEPVTVQSAAAAVPVQLPGAAGAGTVNAGPGTLTLASPLQFAHAAGTIISALPADVIRAAALHAAVEALETIDAIATQSMSGEMAGGTGVLAEEAEKALDSYLAVI
jgi:hypothetical protein